MSRITSEGGGAGADDNPGPQLGHRHARLTQEIAGNLTRRADGRTAPAAGACSELRNITWRTDD